MPESSFEHSVQQSLDELRLKPSAQVWEEVERRIQKEKRRRRVLIFWLPLITMFAGGGMATAILLHQRSATPVAVNHTPTPPSPSPAPSAAGPDENGSAGNVAGSKSGSGVIPESAESKDSRQSTNLPGANAITPGIGGSGLQRKNSSTQVHTYGTAPVVKTKTRIPEKSRPAKLIQLSHPYPGSTFTMKRSEDPSTNVQANAGTTNSTTGTTSVERPDIPAAPPLLPEIKATEAEPEQKEIGQPEDAGKKPEALPVVSAPLVPRPPFKKRWEWGISFSPSFSQISDALLNVPFAEEKTISSSAGLSNNPSGIQPPADNEISYKLYDIGFSYQAGVFVQKDIFKRSRIRLGLNYSYHSTSIQTGSLQATSVSVVNGFGTYNSNGVTYQFGVQQPYKTKFSYLETPLTYQVRIGKGKNVPFLMHGSLVPAVLLGSNMLHYDSTVAGVYFVDNKRLNPFLLSYETGLAVELGKKAKYPVTIGTQLRLGLSNLLKPAYGNRYMLSGGFQLTLRKRSL